MTLMVATLKKNRIIMIYCNYFYQQKSFLLIDQGLLTIIMIVMTNKPNVLVYESLYTWLLKH